MQSRRSHAESQELSVRWLSQGYLEYTWRPSLMHCNSFQRSVPASNFIHFQFFLLLKSSMAFHCPKNNHQIILHPQFPLITLLCAHHIETHTHTLKRVYTHTQTKICQNPPIISHLHSIMPYKDLCILPPGCL